MLAMAALVLSACGGGGSDATTSAAQGTISGFASKGPVSGATVRAFAIGNGGMGAQIGSAMTDAQGAFTVSIGDFAGSVMLQMIGGAYTDEATGIAMPMASGDAMTAAMPSVSAGVATTGVQLTPVTSMAQAMSQTMSGGMTDTNIAAANAALGNYFMVGDILHTEPMNPLVAGSGAQASQSAMNYGMTLAAMSQYAKSQGMGASSGMVTAMMTDASDGVMDGRAAAGQVGMGGGMMSGGMMSPNAGTTDLANAMTEFMSSTMNRSGVAAANMASLMQQLRNADGRMH